MPQVVLYAANATDVGYGNSASEFFSGGYSSSYCEIGSYSSNSDTSWVRIRLDQVPAGTKIDSATLTLTAYSSQSGTNCIVSIRANDSDSPTIPTSASELLGLQVCAVAAGFTVDAWTAGETYTFDITTVIQDFVNRVNFVTSNYILLLISNNGSTSGAYRQFDSVSYNSGENTPYLTVEYSTFSVEVESPPAKFTSSSGAQIEGTLPVVDFVTYSGAVISGSLPLPSVTILGGRVFSMGATLPSPTASFSTGATIATSFPSPTFTTAGVLRMRATLSCTASAPSFSMDAAGEIFCSAPAAVSLFGSGASIACTAPVPAIEITATSHIFVQLSGKLPSPRVSINALTGLVAALDCRCPIAKSSFTNDPVIRARVNGVLPGGTVRFHGTAIVVGELAANFPAPVLRIHALSTPTWVVDALQYDSTRVA